MNSWLVSSINWWHQLKSQKACRNLWCPKWMRWKRNRESKLPASTLFLVKWIQFRHRLRKLLENKLNQHTLHLVKPLSLLKQQLLTGDHAQVTTNLEWNSVTMPISSQVNTKCVVKCLVSQLKDVVQWECLSDQKDMIIAVCHASTSQQWLKWLIMVHALVMIKEEPCFVIMQRDHMESTKRAAKFLVIQLMDAVVWVWLLVQRDMMTAAPLVSVSKPQQLRLLVTMVHVQAMNKLESNSVTMRMVAQESTSYAEMFQEKPVMDAAKWEWP